MDGGARNCYIWAMEMNGIYRACYCALFIHFLRRVADRIGIDGDGRACALLEVAGYPGAPYVIVSRARQDAEDGLTRRTSDGYTLHVMGVESVARLMREGARVISLEDSYGFPGYERTRVNCAKIFRPVWTRDFLRRAREAAHA